MWRHSNDLSRYIINWSYLFHIHFMMTSSNGNIFCVTGPLWGESTGDRWLPLTKASDAGFWCFRWYAPEKNDLANNREAGDLRRHRAHYDVTVTYYFSLVQGGAGPILHRDRSMCDHHRSVLFNLRHEHEHRTHVCNNLGCHADQCYIKWVYYYSEIYILLSSRTRSFFFWNLRAETQI